MKNRNICHAYEEVKIYGDCYKPSINMVRFVKSIVSVFLYGSSTPTQSYLYNRRKWVR